MIIAAHAKNPEFFGLDEDECLKAIDAGLLGMGPTANSLRMKFWYEYDLAQSESRNIRAVNIFMGICDAVVFYKKMKDPRQVAWLLTRPASYEDATAEMHQFALKRLRQDLENPDPKMAKVRLEIFIALDNRIKGAVVQKTMNLHAKVPSPGGSVPENARKEELERRILELERDANKQQGKIIDSTIVLSK